MKLLKTTRKAALTSLVAVASVSSIIAAERDEEDNIFSLENVMLPPVDVDGVNTPDIGLRIVGGEKIEPGDYPYFVLMGPCGGALVAPDVVLFAAHCGGDFVNKQVSVGAYEYWGGDGDPEGRFCEEWIQDPNYTDKNPPDYDFALCKLDQPVENFNKGKVRIEMNFDDNFPSNEENLWVMGFGRLKAGGDRPRYLQHVMVNQISNSFCDNAYGGRITDTMLCAGIKNIGKKDACQGDSGGPLVRRVHKRDGSIVDTHVGLVSWGWDCASEQYPGVYARTSKRASWIKDTICNSFNSVASYCNNPAPTCSKAQMTIKVGTDKYPGEVSWRLKDSNNQLIKERGNYQILNYETESDFCLEMNTCYTLEIYDTFGDGVCCCHDSCGSYSVLINGKTVVTGTPDFGFGATHTICTDNIDQAKDTDAPSEEPTERPSEAPTKVTTNEPSEQLQLTTPGVCEDNSSFSHGNFENCKQYIKGSKKKKLRRCQKTVEGYTVQNYWCRKTCARKLKIEAECFPFDDGNERQIGDEGNSERSDRNNSSNVFKMSKTSKSSKSSKLR